MGTASRAVVTSVVTAVCALTASCSDGIDASDRAATVGSVSSSTTPASTAGTSLNGIPMLFDGSREVLPGTYIVDNLGVQLELTFPAGWADLGGYAVSGPNGSYLAFFNPTAVYTDACTWEANAATEASSAADLVALLVAQNNTDTSEPRSFAAGGITGTELEIAPVPGLDFWTCDVHSPRAWTGVHDTCISCVDAAENRLDYQLKPDTTDTVLVLDLNGRYGVIKTPERAGLSEIAHAQVDAILASLKLAG